MELHYRLTNAILISKNKLFIYNFNTSVLNPNIVCVLVILIYKLMIINWLILYIKIT